MNVTQKQPNNLLRHERDLRGWSQRRVAEEVGTSEDIVSRWERGDRMPDPYYREKLCTLFGKNAEELGFLATSQSPHPDQFHIIACSDHLSLLENEMKVRWSLYHTGGASLAYQGLDAWIQGVAHCANLLRRTDFHERVYTLLSMGYQLQGCVLRDLMCYPEAYMAHRKSFLVAQDLYDPELIASALVREGITLHQQGYPVDAIRYFNRALETIRYLGYFTLEGYILQALSEAQAKAQQSQESWYTLGLAETTFEHQSLVPERSLTRLSASSLMAQRGVNAVLLHDYKQAVELIDRSLTNYDPTLIRGRARLLVQKAEAYYGLGIIDKCVCNVQDAFTLAHSVGSKKTLDRIQVLHTNLIQSQWGKDRVVTDLSSVLVG
jgi:transcriptional regulator with XRE-family HTH domain